jgi:hypothetical protein
VETSNVDETLAKGPFALVLVTFEADTPRKVALGATEPLMKVTYGVESSNKYVLGSMVVLRGWTMNWADVW